MNRLIGTLTDPDGFTMPAGEPGIFVTPAGAGPRRASNRNLEAQFADVREWQRSLKLTNHLQDVPRGPDTLKQVKLTSAIRA